MPKPLWDEYQYFLEIEPELDEAHHGKYVAIKDKTVLGIFADYAEAASVIYQQHQRGTVLMQEIGREPAYFTGIFPAVGEHVS